MAGIQYLDELFSTLRSTTEKLTIADSWISKAENSPPGPWRSSFLQAARDAQIAARHGFVAANAQLDELGPADRLPSLLSSMPERLEALQKRLEASEQKLNRIWDAELKKPRGQA